jgi:hypothetical protein
MNPKFALGNIQLECRGVKTVEGLKRYNVELEIHRMQMGLRKDVSVKVVKGEESLRGSC